MASTLHPQAEAGGTARPLKWRINRLRCMTAAEIPFRFARLVRAHLERIAPGAARVPARDRSASPRRWVAAPGHLDAAPYIAAAERIAGGTLSVFSLRCERAGLPPRWNRDPKTGVEAPLTSGKLLDYRDRRLVGDIRYLWELNRHRHLVTLGQAYALTGEARYPQVLREHLESWLNECPCGLGPSWCSALEVAIRLITWALAWQLIGGAQAPVFAGAAGARFRERWLASVYRHARFISGHFSGHSSANNHLIGEAAGLYIAALTWPCWPAVRRWRGSAWGILEREALRQNPADGGNPQQAGGYQRLGGGILLLALLAGRCEGDAFSPAYEERISAMLAFLAAIMNRGGSVPMIGDSDDGIVTQLSEETDFCAYRSLLATGAVLFGSSELRRKAGRLDDQTRWLLGARADEMFARAGAAEAPPPPRPRAFAGGGYYILGCDFDTPPEGHPLADG